MWLKVAVRGPAPSPRSGHTATAISDTKMAVFGGACGASFFSDLHILDMRTLDATVVVWGSGCAVVSATRCTASLTAFACFVWFFHQERTSGPGLSRVVFHQRHGMATVHHLWEGKEGLHRHWCVKHA